MAFVTNRSYVDGLAFDGMRRELADQFSDIYILDTGSDVRANPKISGTQHNVMGIQAGVAIGLFVRNPENPNPGQVHYVRLSDEIPRKEKLTYIYKEKVLGETFEKISRNARETWLNEVDSNWELLVPLIAKKEGALFEVFSNGLQTKKDAWAWGNAPSSLSAKMRLFTDRYEETRIRFLANAFEANTANTHRSSPSREDKIALAQTSLDLSISWDNDLVNYVVRNITKTFDAAQILPGLYRPYVKRLVYYDKHFNGRTFQWPRILPTPTTKNRLIAFSGLGISHPFTFIAVDCIVDLNSHGVVQCLPLYVYNPETLESKTNLTDWGQE